MKTMTLLIVVVTAGFVSALMTPGSDPHKSSQPVKSSEAAFGVTQTTAVDAGRPVSVRAGALDQARVPDAHMQFSGTVRRVEHNELVLVDERTDETITVAVTASTAVYRNGRLVDISQVMVEDIARVTARMAQPHPRAIVIRATEVR